MSTFMRLAVRHASVADDSPPLNVEHQPEVGCGRDDCHETAEKSLQSQRHAFFFCPVSSCSTALNRRQTCASGWRVPTGVPSEQNWMAESRTTGKGPDKEMAKGPEGGLRDAATIDSTRAGLTGPPVDVLHVGSLVDRYIIVERLGAGAMGVVYAAYDPELDRKVALKLLRRRTDRGDQRRRQERLVREAKAIAKLSHPNVVGIFDVGVHEGQVFLAMEYLGGGTLRDWIVAEQAPLARDRQDVHRGRPGPRRRARRRPDPPRLQARQRPARQGNGVPKVVDFGLVRLRRVGAKRTIASDGIDDDVVSVLSRARASTPLTRTGALLGTPAYMAPEQFLGKPVDARTDQFAFCVALYEALYGERPFAGETVAGIADAVTSGRIRPAPAGAAVPSWVRKVILRGLAVEPAQRYPTMSSLLHALATDPAARRRRRIAIAAGVMAVVGLVAGIAAVRSSSIRRQQQIDSDVASKVREAETALAIATEAKPRFLSKREEAFAAFAAMNRPTGERLWRDVLSAVAVLDAS